MTPAPRVPFSARIRLEKNRVEEDFPQSARTGLLHLLGDLVERDYVYGWITVAKEIGRIARATPQYYLPHSSADLFAARNDVATYLDKLEWESGYDFCERLYSHLTQAPTMYRDGEDTPITRVQAQSYVAEELQRLFDEENLAYEFKEGLVERRGKRHTVELANTAGNTLVQLRLNSARTHFSKALHHFRDRRQPDLENAVKEAVCAVEAAAKELFPDAKATTLGEFLKWASRNDILLLPKTIGNTFEGLYGFRNSGVGVAHGGTSGGQVTSSIAEYVLALAASQIILLADIAIEAEEPPF